MQVGLCLPYPAPSFHKMQVTCGHSNRTFRATLITSHRVCARGHNPRGGKNKKGQVNESQGLIFSATYHAEAAPVCRCFQNSRNTTKTPKTSNTIATARLSNIPDADEGYKLMKFGAKPLIAVAAVCVLRYPPNMIASGSGSSSSSRRAPMAMVASMVGVDGWCGFPRRYILHRRAPETHAGPGCLLNRRAMMDSIVSGCRCRTTCQWHLSRCSPKMIQLIGKSDSARPIGSGSGQAIVSTLVVDASWSWLLNNNTGLHEHAGRLGRPVLAVPQRLTREFTPRPGGVVRPADGLKDAQVLAGDVTDRHLSRVLGRAARVRCFLRFELHVYQQRAYRMHTSHVVDTAASVLFRGFDEDGVVVEW